MKIEVLTVLVISCLALIKADHGHSLKKIYANLNDTEKLYFSKYFLTKGCYQEVHSRVGFFLNRNIAFPPEIVQKFESLNVPMDFPVDFVHQVMDTYHLNKTQVLRLARGEQICLPVIGCIDPGDAGNICCT